MLTSEQFLNWLEAKIDSFSLPEFWVKRAWLNPDRLPPVRVCRAEISGARGRRRG